VKLPRDLSGADAVKALERLGFARVRQTGSHIRLSRGSLHVTVPGHSALAPGTLRSILRQSGVGLEEFVRALE
jgi:predicted RNA binding protein YcfA (HicA-like mRNA interferase family)